MHAHWRAHDDYPDSIILTRQTGNPEGRMDLYVLKDFAEIEGRMDQLMRVVQQFEMFVEGGWFPKDEERRKYFWRLHTHIGDPEKLIDHQAQKSDPSKSPK